MMSEPSFEFHCIDIDIYGRYEEPGPPCSLVCHGGESAVRVLLQELRIPLFRYLQRSSVFWFATAMLRLGMGTNESQ
jgi:hypothetical protein